MAKSAARTPTPVHIKVTLDRIRPPIWRRLLALNSMTLGDLHAMIQIAMGWDNGHLHAFEIGGVQYSDIGMMEDAEDEDEITIKKLIGKGISRFGYTYDFGDDWKHALLIEKKPPSPNSRSAPACVAGARACPPEDCGGIGGYYDLLSAFEEQNKGTRGETDEEETERVEAEDEEEDEEHDSESFYADFDPEAFSLDEVNTRLKGAFREG